MGWLENKVALITGGGSIVSTASVAGMCGNMGGSAYGPSKAAVINLTHTAAYELAQHDIRVNCVSPYTMATPMMDFMLKGENGAKMLEFYAGDNMFHKLVEPIQAAYAVLFLASDESSGITEQNIPVDYGFTVKGFSYIKEVFEKANTY